VISTFHHVAIGRSLLELASAATPHRVWKLTTADTEKPTYTPKQYIAIAAEAQQYSLLAPTRDALW
jgi:hypothetical protein